MGLEYKVPRDPQNTCEYRKNVKVILGGILKQDMLACFTRKRIFNLMFSNKEDVFKNACKVK